MRIINGILYSVVGLLFVVWVVVQKREDKELSGITRYLKHHLHIPVLLLLVNSISFGMTFLDTGNLIYIEKDNYGGQIRQVDFLLAKGESTEQITLDVRPKQFTKEEQEKKMKEAFSYLDMYMKGNNESLSKVTSNLDFSIDYEKYPFDVEFQPENYALIDGEGNLKNKEEELIAAGYDKDQLLTGIETYITVLLWYGDEYEKKVYDLLVFPKEKNLIEQSFTRIEEYIKNQEADAIYQEGFRLSSPVDGVQITRLGDKGITPFNVILFGILIIGLLFFREQEDAKKKEMIRREMLIKSYPWFVNELVLLLGAGMQVKNIFQVLLRQYEKENGFSDKKTDHRYFLMKEIKIASHSLELGMPEQQVYHQLGRRLKLSCYIKLMTLLEQNVLRGSKGLSASFEREELDALEERKNLARRYGEEAGTKLLGPMVLLLMVVICMIMVPAFLSFL